MAFLNATTFEMGNGDYPLKNVKIAGGDMVIEEAQLFVQAIQVNTFEKLGELSFSDHWDTACGGADADEEILRAIENLEVFYALKSPCGLVVAFDETWSGVTGSLLVSNVQSAGTAASKKSMTNLFGSEEEQKKVEVLCFRNIAAWVETGYSAYWAKSHVTNNDLNEKYAWDGEEKVGRVAILKRGVPAPGARSGPMFTRLIKPNPSPDSPALLISLENKGRGYKGADGEEKAAPVRRKRSAKEMTQSRGAASASDEESSNNSSEDEVEIVAPTPIVPSKKKITRPAAPKKQSVHAGKTLPLKGRGKSPALLAASRDQFPVKEFGEEESADEQALLEAAAEKKESVFSHEDIIRSQHEQIIDALAPPPAMVPTQIVAMGGDFHIPMLGLDAKSRAAIQQHGAALIKNQPHLLKDSGSMALVVRRQAVPQAVWYEITSSAARAQEFVYLFSEALRELINVGFNYRLTTVNLCWHNIYLYAYTYLLEQCGVEQEDIQENLNRSGGNFGTFLPENDGLPDFAKLAI